jgi:hypothetical protein
MGGSSSEITTLGKGYRNRSSKMTLGDGDKKVANKLSSAASVDRDKRSDLKEYEK